MASQLSQCSNKCGSSDNINGAVNSRSCHNPIKPYKIANAASFYDLSTELLHVHLLMRENMMWWWLALEKKSDDGGLPLLANPTTVMCNNMQNNYFLSGRKTSFVRAWYLREFLYVVSV
jgi:hypothetical protein